MKCINQQRSTGFELQPWYLHKMVDCVSPRKILFNHLLHVQLWPYEWEHTIFDFWMIYMYHISLETKILQAPCDRSITPLWWFWSWLLQDVHSSRSANYGRRRRAWWWNLDPRKILHRDPPRLCLCSEDCQRLEKMVWHRWDLFIWQLPTMVPCLGKAWKWCYCVWTIYH